jgi:hypothetical protein
MIKQSRRLDEPTEVEEYEQRPALASRFDAEPAGRSRQRRRRTRMSEALS